MGVSKVVINNDGVENVLVDITDSTVTPETLAEGETAYGANGEKITGTMKAGSDPVQSDWLQNDTTAPDYIKNKPFGGGSNSISWASAGIDFNSVSANAWVKVSNAVVTEEDIADITASDPVITWYMEHEGNGGNLYSNTSFGSENSPFVIKDGYICIDIIDFWGNGYEGVQFRADGVYFWSGDMEVEINVFPVSVTIPNFGKFESATTIDSKYLPEGLQTETINLSNTLVIESIYDANTGLTTASKVFDKEMFDGYIKVSSASIQASAFDSIGNNKYNLGDYTDEMGYHVISAEELKDGFYRVWDMDENGNESYGGYCAAAGSGYDPGLYLYIPNTASVTFFYGAIFETRTPKPIDKKYLPDDIGMPEVTEADNGKFLRVVDGAWSAVAVPNAEGVGF